MPDGLIVLDHQMRIVDWNSAALKIWRLDGSRIMGAPIAELIPRWSEVIPHPTPDAYTGSLEEGDGESIYRLIDVELRRLSTPSARYDGWIVLFHDSTQLRAAELRLQEANARLETLNRELLRQAIHDGLTGLFNRSYLDEALPRELARAERDDRHVGLLILDIDHFKDVNDRHGHGAGDRVLARVAKLARTLVRAGDIPCRYGGDELVAVMPGATREEAMQAGERIRSSVADDRAVAEVDPVTVSVGVAVYPEDATSATDLFRRADRALYEAKDLGRNRVVGATHVRS
ncbi:MAG: GGDEF domain-containing protein [Spirochaetota bacterium]